MGRNSTYIPSKFFSAPLCPGRYPREILRCCGQIKGVSGVKLVLESLEDRWLSRTHEEFCSLSVALRPETE